MENLMSNFLQKFFQKFQKSVFQNQLYKNPQKNNLQAQKVTLQKVKKTHFDYEIAYKLAFHYYHNQRALIITFRFQLPQK